MDTNYYKKNPKTSINKYWWKKLLTYLKWNTKEIAFGALLIAFSISLYWLKIHIGTMQATFDYLFYMIIAFVFSFYKASIIGFIVNTLLSLLRGTIGVWMINYAMVPVLIALLISLFKNCILNKEIKNFYLKAFFVNLFSLVLIACIILLAFAISEKSKFFDKLLFFYIFYGIFFAYNIIFYTFVFVKIKDQKKQKWLVKINTFILLFLIIMLPFIGALNVSLYFEQKLNIPLTWNKFYLFVFERMIKVFIYAPFYTIILVSLIPISNKLKTQYNF